MRFYGNTILVTLPSSYASLNSSVDLNVNAGFVKNAAGVESMAYGPRLYARFFLLDQP